jgi:hypothetical protein
LEDACSTSQQHGVDCVSRTYIPDSADGNEMSLKQRLDRGAEMGGCLEANPGQG